MTIYAYQCTECQEVFDMNKKIAERDSIESDECPACKAVGKITRLVSAPTIGYGVTIGASGKPPDGFREVLRNIHKRAPGSQLDKTSSFM